MSNDKPTRMCGVCKERKTKDELFRVAKKAGKMVFDKEGTAQSRGFYICKTHNCVKKLSKNKKINLNIDELTKMLKEIPEDTKDYLKVLDAMRNSEFLTFGMKMVFEEIKKIHFILIAEDISEKNGEKIIRKAKEDGIRYVHFGTRAELGKLFSKKEVTVIGVKSKKVARGL